MDQFSFSKLVYGLLRVYYTPLGTRRIDAKGLMLTNFAYDNDLSVDANYQKVCNKIDIDSPIDYTSVETYVCNVDWSGNSTPGEYPFYWNWDMWRTKTTDSSKDYYDGKWRYVIYDLDQSSGAWGSCSSGSGKILVFIGDHVTYEQYILETIDVTSCFQNLASGRLSDCMKCSFPVPHLSES